jgi:hypothetical protein
MRQSEPSPDAGQPDVNPYAPPKVELIPELDNQPADQAESQRKAHLLRESCIRVTGLLCLIMAVIVLLTFGLGSLYELRRDALSGEEIEPWKHQRWIARMTSVISLAVIAAVTSWGLFRLRNWGRWALTIVTVLPVLASFCSWQWLTRTGKPYDPDDFMRLVVLSVMSILASLPSLFLLWSPKGRMVFSAGYRETVRQTPALRPGFLGFVPALLTVPAGFASYSLLMVTVFMILVMLGLIRSF